jgi:hypothetical protein
VSVSGSPDRAVLEAEARRQLAGAGDASRGEWPEPTPAAFHLRRRVSVAEERITGPLRDIRGTAEAAERFGRMAPDLAARVPATVLARELGDYARSCRPAGPGRGFPGIAGAPR